MELDSCATVIEELARLNKIIDSCDSLLVQFSKARYLVPEAEIRRIEKLKGSTERERAFIEGALGRKTNERQDGAADGTAA